MAGIELLIKIVMALGVVAFIGYPLVKNMAFEEDDLELPEETEELYSRKESTYSAIKELEFDYRTGKLSEEDYRELDTKYRAEALEILEAIDLHEKGAAPAQKGGATKKAAAPKKKAKPAASKRAVTAEPASLTALVCGECGRENVEGSRFCASCGQALVAEEAEHAARGNGSAKRACEECGEPVKAGHKFCAACGAEVRA